ncbi:hypothetical protein E2562_018767 [Oryza meyeriana var. granulata]|uniref:Uncharacterized protein n=1 Tax=Oryza meyeriana var. granulata TaxID=110450 RepID=A0A6G1EX84_9ORYZ|nr:hypothetical protein E2562_018767 [Oryza meyeriana var. granulata]
MAPTCRHVGASPVECIGGLLVGLASGVQGRHVGPCAATSALTRATAGKATRTAAINPEHGSDGQWSAGAACSDHPAQQRPRKVAERKGKAVGAHQVRASMGRRSGGTR